MKLPRVARDRRDEAEIVVDYQETLTSAVKILIDYFRDPSDKMRRRLIDHLDGVTSKTVGIRKRVEHDGQFNLFTED